MIPKFSVRRPYTVLVMVVAILVLGYVSFTRMTPELFPNINLPYVMVMTSYPGATPEEVEKQVTTPFEEQLATLEDLKEMQSQSSEGYSLIMLEFDSDANLDIISVDIRDKIDLADNGFEEQVGEPIIYKMNPNIIPTTIAAVNREGMSTVELSTFVEEDLLLRLEGIDGVASVTTAGVVESTIHVALDADKIKALNDALSATISAQTEDAKGEVRSGISAAEAGRSQVQSGKTQVAEAQQALAQQQESITQALEQLQGLLQAKEAAEQLGDQETVQAMDASIRTLVAGLAPYQESLSSLGVDLTKAAAGSQGAAEALSAFRVGMSRSSDELSNQMSELAATDAYLQSTIAQLEATLSTIDSQAEAVGSMDLVSALSAANLSQIIAAENFEMPAGYLSEDGTSTIVSVGEEFTDLAQIEDLIVFDPGLDGFGPIRISDVATVTYLNNGEDVYAKIDGEDGILLSFSKQSDVATAKVSENIQEAFSDLSAEYDGLSFHILSDQGDYIHIIVNSVLKNLLIGGLLAVLILLLFLRDWKPTLITAISIPVSLTFALVLMYFSGVTLNIISLAGLAVGVGMLVDNSIVVIENIYRLRHVGYTKVQAAVSGAGQVAGAITASTLTTICVFLPIVFVQGITRQIFTDMALTIGYSLFASLFIALTVVPAMGSLTLAKTNDKAWLSDPGRGVLKWYMQLLDAGLSHRAVSLLLAVALLVGSAALLAGRGLEFMPGMASQQITANIYLPDDATKQEALAIADEIAEETMALEGVDTVGIMPESSTSSIMGFSSDIDYSLMDMYVLLDEEAMSDNAAISAKITALGEERGCEMYVSGDTDMTEAMGSSDFVVNIFGSDIDALRQAAKAVQTELASMDGLTDISDIDENSMDEVLVVVDKNKAMARGLTVAQVYQALSEKLSNENTATAIRYDGGDRDIVLSTGEKGSSLTRSELADLTLSYTDATTGETKTVRLSDIATIRDGRTLSYIGHLDQARGLQVTASSDGTTNITLLQEGVEKHLAALDLPDGVRLSYDGQSEQIMEAMEDLVKMLLLGLLLIYLIMVAQFQSLKSPFIVMFTVPLAFTGGFQALLITGNVLSVVGMIGFVVLMGIIVNNGIVLVDYIGRLRADGKEKREAIREACSTRIRPVLMTAVTTVLGLLPLAFGLGEGSSMVRPVAIVCIGGLLYATLMTLLIIPIIYDLFHRKAPRSVREEELTLLDVE